MPRGCPACQSTSFLLTHWTGGRDGCGLLSPGLFHIEVVDLGRLGPASVAVGRAFQRRWQLGWEGAGGFFGSVIALDFKTHHAPPLSRRAAFCAKLSSMKGNCCS